MTECEWRTSADAKAMLRCLIDDHGAGRKKAGRRKLRLFGCACCRRRWAAMVDPRSRAAVAYVERLADGEADPALLPQVTEDARQALSAIDHNGLVTGRWRTEEHQAQSRAATAAFMVAQQRPSGCAHVEDAMRSAVGAGDPSAHGAWLADLAGLADLFREIFGNPFRPAVFGRAWRSNAVRGLAWSAYETGDFSTLPILADAVQDAGCDDTEILAHCRGPGPHFRGCWAIDRVLGKG